MTPLWAPLLIILGVCASTLAQVSSGPWAPVPRIPERTASMPMSDHSAESPRPSLTRTASLPTRLDEAFPRAQRVQHRVHRHLQTKHGRPSLPPVPGHQSADVERRVLRARYRRILERRLPVVRRELAGWYRELATAFRGQLAMYNIIRRSSHPPNEGWEPTDRWDDEAPDTAAARAFAAAREPTLAHMAAAERHRAAFAREHRLLVKWDAPALLRQIAASRGPSTPAEGGALLEVLRLRAENPALPGLRRVLALARADLLELYEPLKGFAPMPWDLTWVEMAHSRNFMGSHGRNCLALTSGFGLRQVWWEYGEAWGSE